MRQLISSDQAVQAKCQHKKACSDCPFSRKALNGWLGGGTVEEWLQTAHGDAPEPCHTLTGAQCAGLAIYRANVCKNPRHPVALKLPIDHQSIFSTPMEFKEHHETLRDFTSCKATTD